MRLQEVAERLLQLAVEHDIEELFELAGQIPRRRFGGRKKSISRPVTEELREEIRQFAARHDHLTQAEIARYFNVNPGRVSEAIRGFRA